MATLMERAEKHFAKQRDIEATIQADRERRRLVIKNHNRRVSGAALTKRSRENAVAKLNELNSDRYEITTVTVCEHYRQTEAGLVIVSEHTRSCVTLKK